MEDDGTFGEAITFAVPAGLGLWIVLIVAVIRLVG